MNNLMNQMNQMKHYAGWRGSFEILADFFNFVSAKGAFYVHFASCGSLIRLYERLEAVMSGVNAYLMNYMKVYEVGFIKRFFGFGLFCYGHLMNIEKWVTSLIFIKYPAPSVLADISHKYRCADIWGRKSGERERRDYER